MALPQHYLLALINPAGRLSQAPFAFLAILIAFAHMYIYGAMAHMPVHQPWNIYSIALLALIWCKFCIVSRRLHDTGSNGLIAVPFLLVATIFYFYMIDPSFAGPKALQDPNVQALLNHGIRLPRILFIAIFIYCIRAGSESGPNGFGPEFGDTDDGMSRAAAAVDGKRASTMPVHSFKTIGRDAGKRWAPRKRPAGFGKR